MSVVWIVLVPLLAQLALARAGHDVPVMLWCPNCSGDMVDPLYKTSRNQFEDILMEKLGKTQPPTVVFLKDNFCAEDVKKHQESLQKFNSANSLMYLTYLTAVESALSVFHTLPHNVTVEEEVNLINDGQLAIVPITDLNTLPEKHSALRESNPNLVFALTGKSCIYTSAERIKRAADADNNNTDIPKILFHIDGVPSIKFNKDEYVEFGNETSRSANADERSYNLTLNYSGNKIASKITLKAHFNKSQGYFEFLGIEYTPDGESEKMLYLNSKSLIEFPFKFGYHCGQSSVFTSKQNLSEEVSVKLLNLQVQMDTDKFGSQVYDCVGFMSIPIWTGIFVTAILAIIMIWGLIMIMDIRTMDRFDDPKGKTITVSAQD